MALITTPDGHQAPSETVCNARERAVYDAGWLAGFHDAAAAMSQAADDGLRAVETARETRAVLTTPAIKALDGSSAAFVLMARAEGAELPGGLGGNVTPAEAQRYLRNLGYSQARGVRSTWIDQHGGQRIAWRAALGVPE